MKYLTIIFCVFCLAITVLPLIDTAEWWIRIFDFPRIQIGLLCLIAFVMAYFYLQYNWLFKAPLLVLLLAAGIFQFRMIIPYTPLSPITAKDSAGKEKYQDFSILISNVLMDNEDKLSLINLIHKFSPDIILLTEPNQEWAVAIDVFDQEYPYSIKEPKDNTYGIILLSKIPIVNSELRYLVKDDIPSVFAQFELPNGEGFDFYGLHPEPPKPGTDTYERDTELLIVGKMIKEKPTPSIVAGDLNDVGWSETSSLFRKYSQLVDPRKGRGMFNTYNVNFPLLRYPLDHIFYTKDFGLTKMERLEDIGSDHFPIFIELTFEPDQGVIETTDAKENDKLEQKIEEGK